MLPITNNSYLVEINLGTLGTQKQVFFPFVPQLEKKQIYGVQTFSVDDIAKSPNGVAIVSSAAIAGLTATFVVGDQQDIYLVPCSDLRSRYMFGMIRTFNNKVFNLTKSFITMQDTAVLTANTSILFNFIYK